MKKNLFNVTFISYVNRIFLRCHYTELQRRIQKRGLGGPSPLFLNQTEARWAQQIFLKTGPPSLVSGSGWLPPLPLSDGLDPPLCYTITNHTFVVIISPFAEAKVKCLQNNKWSLYYFAPRKTPFLGFQVDWRGFRHGI